MKPSRNAPCPCGSGKKYKHCCLIAGRVSASAPADLVWRRLRVLLEHHSDTMLEYIHDTYGPAALDEAWEGFAGYREIEFDGAGPLTQVFLSWFFHAWSPDPADTNVRDASLHEVIPTRLYLDRKGRHLDPLLRRYLESLLLMPYSYFEVVAVTPGSGMTLRDVMTHETYDVTERSASRSMQRGDLLFGQLATLDRLVMLEASNCFAISPIEKGPIVELRSRIAAANAGITHAVLRDYDFEMIDLLHDITQRAFDTRLPELRNTDGDPLSPRKLVFDLEVHAQEAFDALKHLALDESDEDLLRDATRDADGNLVRASITWKRRGNAVHADWENTVLGTITIDGKRLTAEVNSEARADAATREIEAALGERAQFRVTQVQSIEKLLEEARARGGRGADDDQQRLAELPEVRAKLAEMMAAHFERWVDQALPALGGRTPMEAVTDADGREVVESLVIQAERHGRAMNPPTDEAVFRRLRERLGLSAR